MKLQRINCLGFLSLLALLALLGRTTGNEGFYGFLGFAYYLRYFFVQPDELFRLNLQKSATFAFLAEMLSLVPLVFVGTALADSSTAVVTAFGLSFAVGIFAFTGALLFWELREQRGAGE